VRKFFVGAIAAKVDKKGRVSVPAKFRAVLKESAFYALPSPRNLSVECRTEDVMERLSESFDELDTSSVEQDRQLQVNFGEAFEFTIDGDGRTVLSDEAMEHTGITDSAIFVGKGKLFQIWEPAAYRAHRKQASQMAIADRAALRQRPQAGNLGSSGPVENGT